MRTRAVVLDAGGAAAVRDLEVAAPAPTEVVVRMAASGLCQTDRHVLRGTLPHPHRLPLVLGHEGAGTVLAVGIAVDTARPGDRVVLLSAPACGRCWFCLRGEGHSCATMGATRAVEHFAEADGSPVAGYAGLGTFAEAITVDRSAVLPVRSDLPAEQLALVSCAVVSGAGAMLTSPALHPGASVVVIGCGAVGLSAIQGARLAGATTIVAIDPSPRKLAAATHLGATTTAHPHALGARDVPTTATAASATSEPEPDDDHRSSPSHGPGDQGPAAGPGARGVPDVVAAATGGRGADVAVEAVGSAAAAMAAVRSTRIGGTTLLLGLAPPGDRLDLPLAELVAGRKQIVGSIYGGGDPRRLIPDLVALADAGRLDLAPLVTHTITLDAVAAALATENRADVIRSVVHFPEVPAP